MADITMCTDKACPKNKVCYRYRAKPNIHWQSYFSETPREEGLCLYFIQTKEGDNLVTNNE